MADINVGSADWVPAACTLPTAEQPIRLGALAQLFTTLRSVRRLAPTRLRLELPPDPGTAGKAAELMVRENDCCAFFSFTLTVADGQVLLDVAVPDGRVGVLDGLAAQASAGLDRG